MKKFLSLFLCFCSFFVAKANDVGPSDELLAHVDLILFVLERNSLRMERYNFAELDDDINIITKKISKGHSVFKVSLTAPNSRAKDISWDVDNQAFLKIVAGKKQAPEFYYLVLDTILPLCDVEDEEVSLLLFDCEVELSKELKKGKKRTAASWSSTVNIIVPAGDLELSMQLLFDGRVDAACGFFVQHDLFEKDAPLIGTIKINEALERGFLLKDKPLLSSEDDEFAGFTGLDPDESFDLPDDSRFSFFEKEEPKSFCSKFKEGFYSKLAATKQFFNTSWKKLWSLCV